MKIGIIGAGNVGTGLGKRLAAEGHDIVISFGRDPEKVRDAALARARRRTRHRTVILSFWRHLGP
jgi:predicted dinucleotide-binding enzyme